MRRCAWEGVDGRVRTSDGASVAALTCDAARARALVGSLTSPTVSPSEGASWEVCMAGINGDARMRMCEWEGVDGLSFAASTCDAASARALVGSLTSPTMPPSAKHATVACVRGEG